MPLYLAQRVCHVTGQSTRSGRKPILKHLNEQAELWQHTVSCYADVRFNDMVWQAEVQQVCVHSGMQTTWFEASYQMLLKQLMTARYAGVGVQVGDLW